MSFGLVVEKRLVDVQSLARDIREWRPAWLIMLLTDIVALELCVLLGYLTRLMLAPIWPIVIRTDQFAAIALGVLALPVALHFMGTYPGYGVSPILRLRQRAMASFVLFGLLISWNYLQQSAELSRGVLIATMVYALFVPFIIESLVQKLLIRLKLWGQPTVILGAGKTGASLVRLLQRRPELGLIPVGLFDDDESLWGESCEDVQILGPLAHAAALDHTRIRTAILTLSNQDEKKLAALLQKLRFENVIIVPRLFGVQSLWISPIDLDGVVGLRVKNNLAMRHNYLIKRALDYAISIPAALISLPILLFSALWILMVDGWPIIYTQERRGYRGQKIRVLKLRTMYRDAEQRLETHLSENPDARAEWERFFKLKKDPRVLPGVGSFLRRTSLDELPQIYNVIRGDMSLVGPRPFPEYHLCKFDQGFCDVRASVPPGLTGLWQVSARSDGDLDVQESLDSYYIRNWSLWLDLYVLMRTFVTVIRGSGAY
ncbi:MAG: exopolysaccharide biosynthesis polyprenyl glycosylphosphotransferase [Alphaproteobacteria bacterium]|nr:exopolysaccharide biosynthesis polyprenyl glycosylphosphotransferase [Alphaproteobacteria bacterium]